MGNWVIDIVTQLVFFALGVACLLAAGQISGASFDPLGSTAIPYAVGIFIVGLTSLCTLKTIRSLQAQKSTAANETDVEIIELRALADSVLMLFLAITYVASVFIFQIPFSIGTLVFVPAASCLLHRSFEKRTLLIGIAAGVIIGFGGELLFTKVFFVDLPAIG